jgi:hypothetical protein
VASTSAKIALLTPIKGKRKRGDRGERRRISQLAQREFQVFKGHEHFCGVAPSEVWWKP